MTDSTIRTRSDQRRQADRAESQETSEEDEREREQCPECGGRLVSDAEHAETVCEDCGLV
ncbi:transcription initiation factor IIB, partial [Halobiforma lacisalsi AJ5]